MTETPQQTYPPGPQPGDASPPPGWNTQNLKDYRQLRRSRLDRKVAGVSGGLARHLDVDPTIIRVLFVVLAVFGGAGLLLYAALWVLVPEEGSERTVLSTSDATRNTLLIIALVVAGLIAIGNGLHGFGYPWLIAGGLIVAAVLVARDRNHPVPPQDPNGWTPAAPAGTATPFSPGSTVPPSPPPAPPGGGWQPAPARRPKKAGPLLFGPTLALIALSLGALGLYDASGGSVADSAYPAVALGVTGLMLVVGAFVGRAGGLILVGLLATLLLVVTAIGRPSFHGNRDLVVRPATSADVRDSYEVPAGRIELDLSRIADPTSLDGRTINVSANAGEIVVVVPRHVDVAYTADVQYGGVIDTPTLSRNGWSPSVASTVHSPGAHATMNLGLRIGFGHIELVRADGIPVPQPATQPAPAAVRSAR